MLMQAELTIDSPYLGTLSWEPRNELIFAAGLPGFERERRMLPVEIPAHRPLVYLQSLDRAEVCFLLLPVFTVEPHFELALADEERSFLLLDEVAAPVIGEDVLCLALLVPAGATVETNLDAVIVVNLGNCRCVQTVSSGGAPRLRRLSAAGRWEPVC